MLLFAPLVIFPALAVIFLFASAFPVSLSSTQNEHWNAYTLISIYGVFIAYIGNTVIGLPIIFILDKFKRLNYLNIMSCLLFLILAFVIKDGRLDSFNIASPDGIESLLWKYLGVLYFSACVATTDYLMIKNKS